MYHQHSLGEPLFCEECYFEIWFKKEGQNILDEILKSSKNKCYACPSTEDITKHHIIPLHCGGLNLTENIVYLCNKHHREIHKFNKDQKNDIAWFKILKDMHDRNLYKPQSNSNNKKEDIK